MNRLVGGPMIGPPSSLHKSYMCLSLSQIEANWTAIILLLILILIISIIIIITIIITIIIITIIT